MRRRNINPWRSENQAGIKSFLFLPNNPVVNGRLSRSNLFHIQTVRSVFPTLTNYAARHLSRRINPSHWRQPTSPPFQQRPEKHYNACSNVF
jgi:hypothetical protein